MGGVGGGLRLPGTAHRLQEADAAAAHAASGPTVGYLCRGLTRRAVSVTSSNGQVTPSCDRVLAAWMSPIHPENLNINTRVKPMETRNMLNLNQEEINEGRRGILRSGPAIGAGIIAPMGVLGSGLLISEPAFANDVTVHGTWRAHPKQGHLDFNHKGKRIRIEIYQVILNGSVVEDTVLCFNENSAGGLTLTSVIRSHKINGVAHQSHYKNVTKLSNPARLYFTASEVTGRRLKAKLGTHTVTDPDSNNKHAGTVLNGTLSPPSGFQVTNSWATKNNLARFAQANRASGSGPNSSFVRGLCILDSAWNDQNVIGMTSWYGNSSHRENFLNLTSRYAALKAAQTELSRLNHEAVAYGVVGAVVWVAALAIAGIGFGAATAAVSVGIATIGLISLVQSATSAQAAAKAAFTGEYISYKAFIEAHVTEKQVV